MSIKPKARRTDPITSWAAAFRAGKFVDSHRTTIAVYLHTIHPLGATGDEIAQAVGLEKAAVERRMIDLHRTLIALPHKTEQRKFRTGCNGRVHYAVKSGSIPPDLQLPDLSSEPDDEHDPSSGDFE